MSVETSTAPPVDRAMLRTDPEFLSALPEGSIVAFGPRPGNPDRWIRAEDGWLKIDSEYPFGWDEATLLSYYPSAEGWAYGVESIPAA